MTSRPPSEHKAKLQIKCTLAAACLVLLYHYFRWSTLDAFVLAVDHHPRLFQDFLGHYFPMSVRIENARWPVGGYFYSAFFAVLLSPLRWINPRSLPLCWGLIQTSVAVGLSIVSMQLLKLRTFTTTVFFSLLFWFSFPVAHNFKWGQVSSLLVLFVMLAIYFDQRNTKWLAGASLALAISIKFYPALFLIYFLMFKRWKTLFFTMGWALLFYVIVPCLVMGWDRWRQFEILIRQILTTSHLGLHDVNSQFFAHVLKRWFAVWAVYWSPSHFQWFLKIGITILVLNTLFALITKIKALPFDWIFVVLLVFLSLPFVITTSWPHYFVYLPFCQMAVFLITMQICRLDVFWFLGVIFLCSSSMICSNFLFFEVFANWQKFSQLGIIFLSNSILLLAVYLLVLKCIFKSEKKILQGSLASP